MCAVTVEKTLIHKHQLCRKMCYVPASARSGKEKREQALENPPHRYFLSAVHEFKRPALLQQRSLAYYLCLALCPPDNPRSKLMTREPESNRIWIYIDCMQGCSRTENTLCNHPPHPRRKSNIIPVFTILLSAFYFNNPIWLPRFQVFLEC